MMGGASFQRQGTIFSGVGLGTLNRSLHKFTKAVIAVLKADYLHLPTMEMLRKNDQYIRNKYNLPGFGWGVDGVLFPFEEKPRRIPQNRIAQQVCFNKGFDRSMEVKLLTI